MVVDESIRITKTEIPIIILNFLERIRAISGDNPANVWAGGRNSVLNGTNSKKPC